MNVLTLRISLISKTQLGFSLTTSDSTQRMPESSYETSEISELAQHLADGPKALQAATRSGDLQRIRVLGARYGSILLPEPVKIILDRNGEKYLILDLEEAVIHFPWEAIGLPSGDLLCQRFYIGRHLRLRGQRPNSDKIAIRAALVIADPAGDLPSAGAEGAALKESLTAGGLPCTFLSGSVTKDDLLARLADASMFHYSGHSLPGALLVKDGELLSSDLKSCLKLPYFVFLNSCSPNDPTGWQAGADNLGKAFLKGGTYIFLSPITLLDSAVATGIARSFYDKFLRGMPVGEALYRATAEIGDGGLARCNYVLYGHPLYRATGADKVAKFRISRSKSAKVILATSMLLALLVLVFSFKDKLRKLMPGYGFESTVHEFMEMRCNAPYDSKEAKELALAQLDNPVLVQQKELMVRAMILTCVSWEVKRNIVSFYKIEAMNTVDMEIFYLQDLPYLKSEQRQAAWQAVMSSRKMIDERTADLSVALRQKARANRDNEYREELLNLIFNACCSESISSLTVSGTNPVYKKKVNLKKIIGQTGKVTPSIRYQVKDDDPPIASIMAKAEAGNPEDQFFLATHYQNGKDVPRDDKAALFWYKKAAMSQEAKPRYHRAYGDLLYQSATSHIDLIAALKELNIAVKLNDPSSKLNRDALQNYIHREARISHLKNNPSEALAFEDIDAAKTLAKRLGDNCPDPVYANLTRFGAASDQVLTQPCALFEEHKPEEARSAFWLKKIDAFAAVTGLPPDPETSVMMAQKYEYGQGVEQNYKQAFVWYEKAAKAGNPYACGRVSHFLEFGLGVDKNIKEAYRWLKVAIKVGKHSGFIQRYEHDLEQFERNHENDPDSWLTKAKGS